MRRIITVILVTAFLGTACSSPELREVQTNTGGVLDCPADTVWHASVSPNLGSPGAAQPAGALPEAGSELAPPGEPQLESETPAKAVFVYVDADRHRTGRVTVEQISGTGWYLTSAERCD